MYKEFQKSFIHWSLGVSWPKDLDGLVKNCFEEKKLWNFLKQFKIKKLQMLLQVFQDTSLVHWSVIKKDRNRIQACFIEESMSDSVFYLYNCTVFAWYLNNDLRGMVTLSWFSNLVCSFVYVRSYLKWSVKFWMPVVEF